MLKKVFFFKPIKYISQELVKNSPKKTSLLHILQVIKYLYKITITNYTKTYTFLFLVFLLSNKKCTKFREKKIYWKLIIHEFKITFYIWWIIACKKCRRKNTHTKQQKSLTESKFVKDFFLKVVLERLVVADFFIFWKVR